MSQTALLVVDIQKGTLAPLIGKENFLENVNGLIDYFHKKDLPIVFIKRLGMVNFRRNYAVNRMI